MKHNINFVMRTADYEQEFAVQRGMDLSADDTAITIQSLKVVLGIPADQDIVSATLVPESDGEGLTKVSLNGDFTLPIEEELIVKRVQQYCTHRCLPEPVCVSVEEGSKKTVKSKRTSKK